MLTAEAGGKKALSGADNPTCCRVARGEPRASSREERGGEQRDPQEQGLEEGRAVRKVGVEVRHMQVVTDGK